MLRKWLCLNETKPPFLHDRLCWRLYFAKQLHMLGKRDKDHPECIFTRSQNSCFDKLRPSSFSHFSKIHGSVLCKIAIDLLYFWDVYDVNLWEEISAEVQLVHAEQISLYNLIVLGKNNRHSWGLNKSS